MTVPRFFVLVACVLATVSASPAQSERGGRVRVVAEEEPWRSRPGAATIGALLRGATATAGARREGMQEVVVEGWISAAFTKRATSSVYPLAASGRAVLRASPGGAPIARLSGGALLQEVSREGEWVRVRRTGWIRRAAVTAAAAAAPPATRTPAPPATPRAAPRAAPAARPVAAVRAPAPRPAPRAPATPSQGAPTAGRIRLHETPAGDTVLSVPVTAPIQVLERRGAWTRVRIEGWTRTPVRGGDAGVTPRALRETPAAYTGREVRWTARFLALRRAEPTRTDFAPGEAYVLAREPNGDAGFVYIAVTPEQSLAFRGMMPMQPFTFTARVRTGRSPLSGHPVLELVSAR